MKRLLAGFVLILTGLAPKGRATVPCGPPYPPWDQCESLADLLVQSVQSLGQLAAIKGDVSAKIVQARRRYFATYPNGPGHAAAEKEFLHLLDEKDFWYLYLYAYLAPSMNAGSRRPPLSDEEMANMLDKLLGLGIMIDGGVNPLAGSQFDDWVAAVKRRSNKFIPNIFADMAHADKRIWLDTAEPYWRYRIARTWAEFAGAHRNPTDDPRTYLRLLFVITREWNGLAPGQSQDGLADRFYQLLSRAFGEDAVLRAAKRVVAAPKTADGGVALVAGQPSLGPYTAFGRALGDTSDRNFGLMNAIQWDEPSKGEQRVRLAETVYQRLGAIYGAQPVATAVAELRQSLQGRTLDQDGKRISVADAVERRLQARGTGYYVRAILADHDRLYAQADVDAAYNRLVSAHGEKTVIAAGDEILSFLKVPYTSVPASLGRVGYRTPADAYAWLAGILSGSLKLPHPGTRDLAENPEYLAWSRFPSGTPAVYGGREWGVKDGKPLPNTISREPFGYWVEVRKTYSIDDEAVLLQIFKRPFVGSTVYPVSQEGQRFLRRMDPEQLKQSLNKLKSGAKLVSETTGTEALEVNGKAYDTHWKKIVTRMSQRIGGDVVEITTRWTSDAVPGGLVRERVEASAGGGTIGFRELAIQHFPVGNLAALKNIPKGEMFQIRPDLPLYASEATRIAEALPPVAMLAGATGDVFAGQTVTVTTVDLIDLEGIQAGRRFRARLDEPLRYRGEIAVQVGADVYLNVRGDASNVTTSVDSVIMGAKPFPLVTSEGHSMLGAVPQPAGVAQDGPTRRLPGARSQPRQIRGLPPGTRLIYLVRKGTASSNQIAPSTSARANATEPPAQPPPPANAGVAPSAPRHYSFLPGGLNPPVPLPLTVAVAEPIDLAGDDDSVRFRARTASPVQYRGDVLISTGADVFLKVIRKGHNAVYDQVALTVDAVVLDGARIPVRTNQVLRNVRIAAEGAATLPAGTRLLFYILVPRTP